MQRSQTQIPTRTAPAAAESLPSWRLDQLADKHAFEPIEPEPEDIAADDAGVSRFGEL